MSTKQDNDEEMSMDEILASIRKYVTDEKPENTEKNSSSSVVNLNNSRGPYGIHLSPEKIIAEDEEEIYDLEDSFEDDQASEQTDAANIIEEYKSTTTKQSETVKEDTPSQEEPILSTDSSHLITQSFSKIIDLQKKNTLKQQEQLSSFSSMTIEEMMMAALKPMLKEWMDQNLPRLVEKVISKEMEKILKNLS